MVQTAQTGRRQARKRIHKPQQTTPQMPMTGAEAVAYWQALPGDSVYADQTKYPGTSAEVARRLRDQEEARTRRAD